MRLISVVLGTKSPSARANESQALLNYGFRFFETQLLWDQGEVIESARVWKGSEENTDLIVRDAVYVTVPRGSIEQLETSVKIPGKLIAPVSTGEPVGRVVAFVNNEQLTEAGIYSSKSIPAGSFVQTTWDEVLLWFE
ncbi:MAG: hypothetical protein P8Y61_12465 [Gammaproteobacteria bacterium]